jgi:hypothetical protein
MRLAKLMTATLAAAILSSGTAAIRPAAAATCLDGLGALDQRMEQDGFWLSGYRANPGWTGVSTPPGTQPNMGMRAAPMADAAPVPGAAGARPDAGPDAAASPFAGVDWQTAPAQALRVLFASAQILGQSRREDACRAVLAAAEQDYEGYIAQLRQAGVEPADIRNWRQKQLVIARPAAEAGGLALESVEGTELRNPQDERLGTVVDVVLAPGGEPAFVVVGRGGFLGLGRDHVAVPWQALRVTPGFDMFVLDATRRQMEAAPRVNRAALGSPEAQARLTQELRGFWAGPSTAAGAPR